MMKASARGSGSWKWAGERGTLESSGEAALVCSDCVGNGRGPGESQGQPAGVWLGVGKSLP